ncbi:MAG: hypothetical protein ACI4IL_06100 [Eubacterium sp.]
MNKEVLYEILNSESENLSSAEIESILNEELDKSPEEMDTDLIDLCLEALDTVDEKKLNKRKHKIRISRMLIAAVMLVLIIGISIPVCAKFLSIDVPEGIVTFYNDCFNVNISNNKYVDDIHGQLEQDGIENAMLPKMMFSLETKISDYAINKKSANSVISFSFSNDDINGYVTIEKYDIYSFINGQNKVTNEFEKIKQIEVNGLSVLVFCNDNVSYISYTINNNEYNITLDCDYETACQIAKTL